jgi:hypothetical protein
MIKIVGVKPTALSRYIHLNPIRANMVDFAEQYRWSSYREYRGYIDSGLVDITGTLLCLSEDRKIAIYLSEIMSTNKNPIVARHFGISPQAVTNVITEIEERLEGSNKLMRKIEEIKCIL